MKRLFLTLILAWVSTTYGGGVGGFDGGGVAADTITSKSGSIHFQEYSRFVNPYLNSSVCLTQDDYYRAFVSDVFGNSERKQKKSHVIDKEFIFQPRVSLKEKCIRYNNSKSGNGECLKTEWANYLQSRIRDIYVRGHEGEIVEKFKYRIPDCE